MLRGLLLSLRENSFKRSQALCEASPGERIIAAVEHWKYFKTVEAIKASAFSFNRVWGVFAKAVRPWESSYEWSEFMDFMEEWMPLLDAEYFRLRPHSSPPQSPSLFELRMDLAHYYPPYRNVLRLNIAKRLVNLCQGFMSRFYVLKKHNKPAVKKRPRRGAIREASYTQEEARYHALPSKLLPRYLHTHPLLLSAAKVKDVKGTYDWFRELDGHSWIETQEILGALTEAYYEALERTPEAEEPSLCKKYADKLRSLRLFGNEYGTWRATPRSQRRGISNSRWKTLRQEIMSVHAIFVDLEHELHYWKATRCKNARPAVKRRPRLKKIPKRRKIIREATLIQLQEGVKIDQRHLAQSLKRWRFFGDAAWVKKVRTRGGEYNRAGLSDPFPVFVETFFSRINYWSSPTNVQIFFTEMKDLLFAVEKKWREARVVTSFSSLSRVIPDSDELSFLRHRYVNSPKDSLQFEEALDNLGAYITDASLLFMKYQSRIEKFEERTRRGDKPAVKRRPRIKRPKRRKIIRETRSSL